MTTDAHAQTNTERLITTVDNTNSILDALAALADTIASGFASVMESLGMVQADVGAINANLQHVESDLQSIDSDLMAIDEDLMAIDGDLQSIDSDLMAIDGDLQSIDSDLMAIDGELSGLSATVGASGAAFNEVNVNMNKISDAVAANSAAINDLSAKLDMISEAVGVVQETVVAPATADPATMLHSDETVLIVAVADFAGSLTKHPTSGVYDASNMFSCDGDVFLDTMTVSDVNEVLSTVEDLETEANQKSPVTEVSLNGVALYETYSTDDAGREFIVINEPRDFDNQFLSAGSSLTIKGETDQSSNSEDGDVAISAATDNNYLHYAGTGLDTSDPPMDVDFNVYFTLQDYVNLESNKETIGYTASGDNIGGTTDPAYSATKAQLGTVELYTVTVNWFATSSDTTCTISSAVETSSGLPNTDRDLLVGLSLDDTSDVGPPTPFTSETVDCNGEDTEITSLSIKAGDVGLNSFISLELSAAGETANVSFNDDGTFDEDGSGLPFRFTGADLTVGGTGLNNLLLELVYDTTQGNSCD